MKFYRYLPEEEENSCFAGLILADDLAENQYCSRPLPIFKRDELSGLTVGEAGHPKYNQEEKGEAGQSKDVTDFVQPLKTAPGLVHGLDVSCSCCSSRFLDLAALEQPGFVFNQMICQMAALLLHVNREDILSPARNGAKEAFARQLAMYLCHVVGRQSQVVVGRFFARDRKTVSHACRVIEDFREDRCFDLRLEQVEELAGQVLSKLSAFQQSI